ncbi:MAG: helix-turn-helix transcriptional regulator [Candidatus Thiodiazotropha taylori]|nr:helix-turn-helix transcriptional regulator [Candidatus Thiodiazotropha endolucinida]MCW4230209.1 helix-turn-helix transcriptional regulator [Candidatus Thiodiazotropha taylori]
MIRCHLSTLMGQHKLKIADVARATGLHRNTITLMYQETASRVDLEAVDRLCALFDCGVGELFEHTPDVAKKQPK